MPEYEVDLNEPLRMPTREEVMSDPDIARAWLVQKERQAELLRTLLQESRDRKKQAWLVRAEIAAANEDLSKTESDMFIAGYLKACEDIDADF